MKTLIEANPSTTEVCSVLRFAQENDPFLGHLGPCDEKWILYDNRRGQWLNRKETRKYYPKPKFHQKKVRVTVWWFKSELIRHRFLNPGETITAEKHCKEVDEIRMCPALVDKNGPILLHDKCSATC